MGCICADGLGHAELYDESLTAKRYQSILYLNLVRSAQQFWPKGQWWFQQDLTPLARVKHGSTIMALMSSTGPHGVLT